MEYINSLMYALGLVTTIYLAQKLLHFAYLYTRPSSLHKYHHGNQPWAFVTGASDGIGLGFARELASNKFNVALHGRNSEKLVNVQSTLEAEFPGIRFRTLISDASTATNADIGSLVASVEDLHLTVLVNNVGGGIQVQPLTETSAEEVDWTINVSARFPAQITRAFIRRFSTAQGPTLIMNIGSGAQGIVPYATVYGGSKAFDMAMSSSLRVEMRAEGLGEKVEVLGVSVGRVTETAHNTEPASFFTPDGRTMARAALARVGCGLPVVVGYLGHAVQIAIFEVLPMELASKFVTTVMKKRLEEARRKR